MFLNDGVFGGFVTMRDHQLRFRFRIEITGPVLGEWLRNTPEFDRLFDAQPELRETKDPGET